MESGGDKWSHACAFSSSENGKRRRLIVLVETLFNFNVSYTSKKIERWTFGSSIGDPLNCVYWTLETSVDLNIKLFTSTVGLAILDDMPWTPRVMKSWSVLLWPPIVASILGDVSRSLRLFSSLCFFLLLWKVRSISGLGSYANGLRMKGRIFLQAQHQHYQNNQKWNKNKKRHLVTFTRLTRYLENLVPDNGTKNLTTARKRTSVVVKY